MRVLLTVAILISLADSVALAQSACESALAEAEKSYELGLFDDVQRQLEPCVKGALTRTETLDFHALSAKAHLAADELDEARDDVAELLRIEPNYEPGPPPRFQALVAEMRKRESEVQVASVSKTNESLRAAPATVVVITAEEIERRGYLDLEQVIHDLPGFDVTRGNGETYSTFYQRGFRSKDNDRILLLLDGVEQNDISSGVAYLSRQYPIGNVDRIEVVYGPASTFYGANAYSGVINVITKPPEAFLSPGKRFGMSVQAVGGSFDTRATEMTLAGQDKSGSMAWSVTGSFLRSDEMDLSKFPAWQYDFGAVDYRNRLRLGPFDARQLCVFYPPFQCGEDEHGNLYEVTYDQQGRAQSAVPTDAGVRRVRELDQATALKFFDRTEDWSLYAKVRFANLTVGVDAWGLDEGSGPWYSGTGLAKRTSGSWAPEHRSFYVKYGRSIGKSLSLNLFTRYRQSDLDFDRTARDNVGTYANRFYTLQDLQRGSRCDGEAPCTPVVFDVEPPRRLADQAAVELTLVYSPRRQFTLVSGLDVKKGTVQTQETESSPNQLVDHTDLGLYAQASYKPLANLSLIAGGRLDYNEAKGGVIDTGSERRFPDSGFGTLFSPRLAVVYLPGRYAVKLIYSEAFKDPTDFEKFSRTPGEDFRGVGGRRSENPDLRPERTRSLELAAGWQRDAGTSLELSAYRTRYEDIVILDTECFEILPGLRFPLSCELMSRAVFRFEMFKNLVEMEVRGLELRGDTRIATRIGSVSLFGNLDYTDPTAVVPATITASMGGVKRVRIGDIASWRANAGVDLPLWKRAGLNLRWNYVGARKTGEGTSVSTNPLRSIDAYSVVNAALRYEDLVAGATVQLIVNNLFDRAYEHPGVLTADGEDLASSIPQPGRTFYARISWGIGRSRDATVADH